MLGFVGGKYICAFAGSTIAKVAVDAKMKRKFLIVLSYHHHPKAPLTGNYYFI